MYCSEDNEFSWFTYSLTRALISTTINSRLAENSKNNTTTIKIQRQENPHTKNMSPKESPVKMSLETHTTSSSTASSTKSAPSSLYSAPTPSTAPSTPAIEEERMLGAALPPVTTLPPTALVTTAQASTTGASHRHRLSPLEREYDPSRDDLPLDELLARPRLPRSPYEIYQMRARVNGRTMKPLKATVAGASRISGEHARRGEEFEKEKERVRALGIEVGKLKLPPKKE